MRFVSGDKSIHYYNDHYYFVYIIQNLVILFFFLYKSLGIMKAWQNNKLYINISSSFIRIISIEYTYKMARIIWIYKKKIIEYASYNWITILGGKR